MAVVSRTVLAASVVGGIALGAAGYAVVDHYVVAEVNVEHTDNKQLAEINEHLEAMRKIEEDAVSSDANARLEARKKGCRAWRDVKSYTDARCQGIDY